MIGIFHTQESERVFHKKSSDSRCVLWSSVSSDLGCQLENTESIFQETTPEIFSRALPHVGGWEVSAFLTVICFPLLPSHPEPLELPVQGNKLKNFRRYLLFKIGSVPFPCLLLSNSCKTGYHKSPVFAINTVTQRSWVKWLEIKKKNSGSFIFLDLAVWMFFIFTKGFCCYSHHHF